MTASRRHRPGDEGGSALVMVLMVSMLLMGALVVALSRQRLLGDAFDAIRHHGTVLARRPKRGCRRTEHHAERVGLYQPALWCLQRFTDCTRGCLFVLGHGDVLPEWHQPEPPDM